MELAIAALRGRLREAAGRASPALARLAAVDAVMEQVLGAREQALLAGVRRQLEQRFERLRPPPDAAPTDWLTPFCQDLQALLLAELDLRLQPLEGLVEALRAGEPVVP